MILLISHRPWPPVEGRWCSQCVNGGSLHDAGAAIGKSADEGIDGIIQEDRLRLDATLDAGSTDTHARRPIRFRSLALCCETRKTCRTRPVGLLLEGRTPEGPVALGTSAN